MNGRLDLIAIVADADCEWTIRTLLEARSTDLGIRQIDCKVVRDPGRDPGVFQRAQDILRTYLRQADYALVMLDREGSGREGRANAAQMESDLERRLAQNGWADEEGNLRAAAIVLDPELEVWAWSHSPHLPAVLGLTEETLAEVLDRFPRAENGKPQRPKEALLAALRRSGRPHSARIFQELAASVSLQADERAYNRFRRTLQEWFALQEKP